MSGSAGPITQYARLGAGTGPHPSGGFRVVCGSPGKGKPGVDESRLRIDACSRGNVKLCTIFPSRFGDANVELKKAVESGRFGRLTLGETTCKWWRILPTGFMS